MRNIVVTAANIEASNSFNNKFIYKFPGGGARFFNNKIGLQSLSQYYSNFNINVSLYNNNKFAYKWIDGTTHDVTMPDGFYEVSTLNYFLIDAMTKNKHYLIDTNNANQYYLALDTNVVYYAVELIAKVLPGTLPAGWSLPAGATWTLQQKTPQFQILDNGFKNIIGYNAGLYPTTSQTSTQEFLSSFTPEVSPVSTIVVTCSLLSNNLNVADNIVFAYSQSTTFGELENFHPFTPAFYTIKDGTYQEMVITFLDQNLRPIKFQDKATTMIFNVIGESDYNPSAV